MAKQIAGTVESTNMKDTIVVNTVRKFRHPMYQKVITRHKKYKVHNEIENVKVGDEVMIQETRPISKEIHFIVVEKINK